MTGVQSMGVFLPAMAGVGGWVMFGAELLSGLAAGSP